MSAREQGWELRLVSNAARRLSAGAALLERQGPQVVAIARVLADALASGGTLLVCGNGGSAACAQHFAAEFSGRLSVDRRPLAAVSLTVDTSALTAIANDYGYAEVFARQVRALGRTGDVLVALSTSGSSENVRRAVDAAREAGITTVGLTGPLSRLGADHELAVPVVETARIQELHDLVLHELAQVVERLVVPDLVDDAAADAFPFVLGEDDVEPFAAWVAASGQALVTTNGVFDLLHQGHQASLLEARTYGDRLLVLVNSDASVRALKGPARPVRGQDERLQDLRRSPVVDHVLVMPDATPERLLGRLRPAVHCKGADYADRPVPERTVVEAGGGRVQLLALLPGLSTSAQEQHVRSHA